MITGAKGDREREIKTERDRGREEGERERDGELTNKYLVLPP